MTPQERLAKTSKRQLTDAIAKESVVTFRVSKDVKDDMKATAQGLELTLTEYLCSLHAIAAKKLKEGSK
jgi:hypothetical protein